MIELDRNLVYNNKGGVAVIYPTTTPTTTAVKQKQEKTKY